MEIVCTKDSPKFTVDSALIQRITFIRADKHSAAPVTLAAKDFSLMTLTGIHIVDFDPQGNRHEDLLPHWTGSYLVKGLIVGDVFTITYRLAPPPPAPVPLPSEKDKRAVYLQAKLEGRVIIPGAHASGMVDNRPRFAVPRTRVVEPTTGLNVKA
jgi:hypothetical protein